MSCWNLIVKKYPFILTTMLCRVRFWIQVRRFSSQLIHLETLIIFDPTFYELFIGRMIHSFIVILNSMTTYLFSDLHKLFWTPRFKLQIPAWEGLTFCPFSFVWIWKQIIQIKEFFRTCNVLPFSCTNLALQAGKGPKI